MPARKEGVRKFIKLSKQSLVERIKELAQESETDPATWITELIEDWILDHRSSHGRKSL